MTSRRDRDVRTDQHIIAHRDAADRVDVRPRIHTEVLPHDQAIRFNEGHAGLNPRHPRKTLEEHFVEERPDHKPRDTRHPANQRDE